MLNKLDAALSFYQNALRVRGQRQELIAANIANADTPNYKARDINFKAAMQNALASATTGTDSDSFKAAQSVAKTSALHLDGLGSNTSSTSNVSSETMFRPLIQGSVDGNTVDMDVERNQFADNAVRYEASITMLNGQLKQLMSALQSQ
ncbi:flagellar basal body rod protein FlgB [mine drainage metagenome]|uniref:Flagellar basal body rod protein FlgB n=1 Tax=mine drainage metagenome TaxID=410659 RepID=A0A1J5SB12_9ZZZZ